ncbi:MAG: glycosyltransferase family 2 protein [Muribaculaceae bacterium]|nr:glycosyltransferase family 2 protein [Muribaculaceae bacterium]
MKHQFNISLIVTTYNWPEALRLSLNSVLRQSMLPSEVLIADDGSSWQTAEVIRVFQQLLPCSVKHIWQEDRGYRRCAVLNKALREVPDDNYVIFIDGDVILHRHFIANHRKLAEPGYYVFGRRVLLTERLSRRVMRNPEMSINVFTPGLNHRLNALYLPWLSPLTVTYKRNKLYGIGCNIAAWQHDIILVNGFDEKMEGWGCEDNEFILRLRNNNLVSKAAKFQGIIYHLWHQQRTPNEENLKYFRELMKHKKLLCQQGLRQL